MVNFRGANFSDTDAKDMGDFNVVLKHSVLCQCYVNISVSLISGHKEPEEPEINVKRLDF